MSVDPVISRSLDPAPSVATTPWRSEGYVVDITQDWGGRSGPVHPDLLQAVPNTGTHAVGDMSGRMLAMAAGVEAPPRYYDHGDVSSRLTGGASHTRVVMPRDRVEGHGLATRHVAPITMLPYEEPVFDPTPEDRAALGAVHPRDQVRSMARLPRSGARATTAWDAQVDAWLAGRK